MLLKGANSLAIKIAIAYSIIFIQETSHARDHPNLISNGTEKGSDGNRDGTTEQPQQKVS